jgi:hypothetical protein
MTTGCSRRNNLQSQEEPQLKGVYTLGYVSSNRIKDGRFRTVRVVAAVPSRRQLKVRTKAGYLAPKEPEPEAIGTGASREAR